MERFSILAAMEINEAKNVGRGKTIEVLFVILKY